MVVDDAGTSLVIGEIGGSSSRWAFVGPHDEIILPADGSPMPGFNPLTGDQAEFLAGMRQHLSSHPEFLKAGRVKIYGAGCGTEARRERMRETIQQLWPAATLIIETDLMGAALGLCGTDPGLVVILGTGMNAGWFNGFQLLTPLPSLGYILGDEGSGADIGRVMLQDAFYQRMPQDVKEAIFGIEGPDLNDTLESIHRSGAPSRALAVHTALLVPFLEHPYVRDLITSRFLELVDVLKIFFDLEQRRQVYATGSVAFGFQDLLRICLMEQGMTLVNVTKDPLRDLILFERRR